MSATNKLPARRLPNVDFQAVAVPVILLATLSILTSSGPTVLLCSNQNLKLNQCMGFDGGPEV